MWNSIDAQLPTQGDLAPAKMVIGIKCAGASLIQGSEVSTFQAMQIVWRVLGGGYTFAAFMRSFQRCTGSVIACSCMTHTE